MTHAWVLIIVLHGAGVGGSDAMYSIEYRSERICNTAKHMFEADMAKTSSSAHDLSCRIQK